MEPTTKSDAFEAALGVGRDAWIALNPEQRASAVHGKIPDLAWFLTAGEEFEQRAGAAGGRAHARGLHEALLQDAQGAAAKSLLHRIQVDPFLLSEFDRDQNVYMGPFYTRVLTRAVPDLLFQPLDAREVHIALEWARAAGMPVTLRGAGTTAMGGAVPGAGGLLLDFSRLTHIHVDRRDGVATVGAGARLKQIHEQLHQAGLQLKNYPSNLGGTLIGWFATGNIGMNAFLHGECWEHVRAVEVVLPQGQHLRIHDDGRLDVLSPEASRLAPKKGREWLAAQGLPALVLRDFAHSEGQFGVILSLTISVEPRVAARAHLIPFESREEALAFVAKISMESERARQRPANLKYLSLSHLESVRAVWQEERRVPADFRPSLGGYVFLDFLSEGSDALLDVPALLGARSRDLPLTAAAVLRDRFRPQQVKRLGPGLIAAEILVGTEKVPALLDELDRVAGRARIPLEHEVYYLHGNRALVIAGYLTDPRSLGFFQELVLAPVLMEIAASRFGGSPYVLGRWSAPFHAARFPRAARARLRDFKRRLDPKGSINGTIFFRARMRMADIPGRMFMATFRMGLRVIQGLIELGVWGRPVGRPAHGQAPRDEAARAGTCVNCGECNSVCPIFHEAGVRLPQILTHMGERLPGGRYGATESVLLDLCMRCGNCAEVCQAGIPHLPLYQRLQESDSVRSHQQRSRHELLLGWIRSSPLYLRKFLNVRPGIYLKRTPASLPGVVRYVLRRAENDAGPEDTCIHCGACVPVCPTSANLEFQGPDARLITTLQERCVGCGTCVEVCPANIANGGKTLRVMEAPTPELLQLLERHLSPRPDAGA